MYMLSNILDEISCFKNDVKTTLWIYPNIKNDWFQKIKKKYKINIEVQVGSSLCERMNNCMILESTRCDQTILVGSDIPTLTNEILLDAFNILSSKDTVVGQSSDGGFYLFGVNGSYNNLIDCFQPMTFLNLQKNIDSQMKSIGFTKVLKDIDTPKDLLVI